MFELTNDQRVCFGLVPVEEYWIPLRLKPSPYHSHTTIAYLDGSTLRKYIETGEDRYIEYEICEQLSEDLRYLMPKTTKGKPVLLSAAALEKRTPLGMGLSWRSRYSEFHLFSLISNRTFYTNTYDPVAANNLASFAAWVERWCAETTHADLDEIAHFAAEPRKHVKFREGDVFRFRINRRLWGYGQLLMDYGRLRREKIPFWNNHMGTPLICGIFQIATERQDITLDELRTLPRSPSEYMMDNVLYYGTFEIIGNLPIKDPDYPICYGEGVSRDRSAKLQCGTLFLKLDDQRAMFPDGDFSKSVIGFYPELRLDVLMACIKTGSNAPYWVWRDNSVFHDLRDPKFQAELEQICEQFNISKSMLNM